MYVKSIMRENVVILLTTEAIDSISHIHSRMPLLSNEPFFKTGILIRLLLTSIHMK